MNRRNIAIDIFRGLTMVLMITVNDFWKVPGVPHFLEHFGTFEDGMGLSDFVYPMFLFAMGMSIPFAIDRRREKGTPEGDIFLHILSRVFALLVMGAFIMNSEEPFSGNKGVYWLVMLAGFFLVWNAYPKDFRPARLLRAAGAVLLAGLAVTFRTPEGHFFIGGWWGILGQIGWMYLFCATVYLFSRGKDLIPAAFWLGLCLVNLSVAPMRNGGALIGPNAAADFSAALNLGNGHSAILALGGLLTVLGERRLGGNKVAAGLGAAAVLALLGAASHQGWIASKGLGTLPWCLFASAVSVVLYTLLRVLEKHGLTGWFKPFEPAGTATLTVYMIPYFFLALWVFIDPVLPAWVCGWAGVLKCLLFSFLCVGAAWGLKALGIKLKI